MTAIDFEITFNGGNSNDFVTAEDWYDADGNETFEQFAAKKLFGIIAEETLNFQAPKMFVIEPIVLGSWWDRQSAFITLSRLFGMIDEALIVPFDMDNIVAKGL